MRPASCGIAPEGWPCIGLAVFTTLVLSLFQCWIPAVLGWIATLFCLHFFRDPERVVPQTPGLAVSPADGRVIRIEPRPDPFSGRERLCVSVFMNLVSVHVNRAPVAARVDEVRYWPGKFFNASLDKASTDNERCGWSLADADGRMWTMVQIAGLVARRIVCRAEAGDALARGERVGMIRFGSRVDLYLPEGYVPAVQLGDKVFAGESPIARRSGDGA